MGRREGSPRRVSTADVVRRENSEIGSSEIPLASVNVHSECEAERGWTYQVEVRRDDGSTTTHTVKLAWVDHNHWTGGSLPPSRTVEAVLKYVIEHDPGQALPPVFDAARVRRWLPRIDQELRTAL